MVPPASVGAALFLKVPFFSPCNFLGFLFWGSSKFLHVGTFFTREWGQKTSLTKLVLKCSVLKQSLPFFFYAISWDSYRSSSKFLHVRTFFVREWGQKTSLTKLILKRSVLKQSLPNLFLQVISWDSYIEPAQNFITYIQSQQDHAPVAPPGSVGAALCLKVPFFSPCNFLGFLFWGSSKFLHVGTFFAQEWGQQLPLLNWF